MWYRCGEGAVPYEPPQEKDSTPSSLTPSSRLATQRAILLKSTGQRTRRSASHSFYNHDLPSHLGGGRPPLPRHLHSLVDGILSNSPLSACARQDTPTRRSPATSTSAPLPPAVTPSPRGLPALLSQLPLLSPLQRTLHSLLTPRRVK